MKRPFGYEEIEHTADWALHVWAADLSGLLHQATAGMYHLMGAVPGEQAGERLLEADGIDAETLLVNFLSEVLHLGEDEGLMIEPAAPALSGFNLRLSARLYRIAAQEKEIKAVTYHHLVVQVVDGGLETTVVFDV